MEKSKDGSGVAEVDAAAVVKTRLSRFRISSQAPLVAPMEHPAGKTVNRLIGCVVSRLNVPKKNADPTVGEVRVSVAITVFDESRAYKTSLQ